MKISKVKSITKITIITSLTNGLGDLTAQSIENYYKSGQQGQRFDIFANTDEQRTQRFLVIGGLLGVQDQFIFTHLYTKYVTNLYKQFAMQLVVFMPQFASFVQLSNAAMKGLDGRTAVAMWQRDIADIMQRCQSFWPLVQLVNLTQVPIRFRPVTNALGDAVWGVIISQLSNKNIDKII